MISIILLRIFFKFPISFITAIMSYERTVELQRWPGIGFGFSVIGGSDTHIPPMICALVRDSPALRSNQVSHYIIVF